MALHRSCEVNSSKGFIYYPLEKPFMPSQWHDEVLIFEAEFLAAIRMVNERDGRHFTMAWRDYPFISDCRRS